MAADAAMLSPRSSARPSMAGDDLAARTARFSEMLQDSPPVAGFTGHTRLSRGIHGVTHGDFSRAAKEMRKNPENEANSAEAFTNVNGIRNAGRVLLHGKGNRLDLQELLSREQCDKGLSMIMSARDSLPHFSPRTTNTTMRVTNLSYDPGPSPFAGTPRGARSRRRVNLAELEPAGAPSLSWRADAVRKETYQMDRLAAMRGRDVVGACLR
mmetsp:Transcript_50284/g.148461  ORF Transcript_50284/g.148461 Transcript_50284/m.148461 type:complete len:212 (+) Transcript_50284:63-698(+)